MTCAFPRDIHSQTFRKRLAHVRATLVASDVCGWKHRWFVFRPGTGKGETMKSSSRLMLMVLAATMALVVAACGADPTATPRPTPTTAGPEATPTPNAEAIFQAEWAELIAAAQAEGEITLVFGGSAGRNYVPVTKAFEEQFGIKVILSAGSGSKQTARVLAEQSAGNYSVDLLMIGGTSAELLAEANGLQEITPSLIHPDVLDTSGWYKGQIWFTDGAQKYVINSGASAAPINLSMRYNTDLVTEADVAGWKSVSDFLDPKWAGKIVALTPLTGGAGGTYYGLMANPNIDAEALLRKMFDPALDVFFTDDFRLIADGVANGKFAFGINIGSAGRDIDKLKDLGLPVERLNKELAEGYDLSGAGSGDNIMLPVNPPHPNAAKLYLNWFLSIEGQTAVMTVSDGEPDPTLRIDIPCVGVIDPVDCRVEGKNYFYPTADPEFTVRRDEFLQKSKDLFAEVRGL